MNPNLRGGRSGPEPGTPPTRTHSVHVRGVPEHVWRRAPPSALLSGLPFELYVPLRLAHCDPILLGGPDELAGPERHPGPEGQTHPDDTAAGGLTAAPSGQAGTANPAPQ